MKKLKFIMLSLIYFSASTAVQAEKNTIPVLTSMEVSEHYTPIDPFLVPHTKTIISHPEAYHLNFHYLKTGSLPPCSQYSGIPCSK